MLWYHDQEDPSKVISSIRFVHLIYRIYMDIGVHDSPKCMCVLSMGYAGVMVIIIDYISCCCSWGRADLAFGLLALLTVL
jgi:hypothetical protein